jgi:pimeloyl-ACP methyl ester carboxylesterase
MTATEPTPLPDRWTEGTVEASGIDIHYTRTGDGSKPPLVVAHGFTDDGPCRAPLARDLETDYDVVAFDARGHGRSAAPASGYDLENRVADLVGAIEALGLARPFLFGHSMGGDTVLAAAARHPGLARAVAVEDPACLLRVGPDADGDEADDGDEGFEGLRERAARWGETPKETLLAENEELRDHVEAGETELAGLLADARRRFDPNAVAVTERGWISPESVFPDIEAPTLVLKADADEETLETVRDLTDRLPDGRLIAVEGAGHCVFRDARETATRELRAFLVDR